VAAIVNAADLLADRADRFRRLLDQCLDLGSHDREAAGAIGLDGSA
jgi:hypothetical protein